MARWMQRVNNDKLLRLTKGTVIQPIDYDPGIAICVVFAKIS